MQVTISSLPSKFVINFQLVEMSLIDDIENVFLLRELKV